VVERVLGQRQPPAEPALVGHRALDDAAHLLVGQRLEPEDTEARQERRVDLEVRVLGGRADERDRAIFDLRQERVLLALVESGGSRR